MFDEVWVDSIWERRHTLTREQRARIRAGRKFDEGKRFPDFYSLHLFLDTSHENQDL